MPPSQNSLRELATLFLRIGVLAFGGPAAHIAMMEEEVVRKRGWLSHQEFLDLMAASNLIPGPNSTEMAIHIGYLRGGWRGLFVAGFCFILPAVLIVTFLAWFSVRFGALPTFSGFFFGVKPVVLAVVIQALWKLSRSALKSTFLIAVALGSVGLSAWGVGELWILFLAALIAVAERQRGKVTTPAPLVFPMPFPKTFFLKPFLLTTATLSPLSLSSLFWVFFKAGACLFGSGYVLLAFLRNDLVERLHWLSESQLLDAIAVGQFTPGPVFTTATYVGYLLSGFSGATVATIAIFLPAFFYVAVTAPFVPRLRQSQTLSIMLDGLNAASLALMAVVSIHLGAAAVVDPLTGVIAVLSLVLVFGTSLNSSWLVLAGGLFGVVSSFFSAA